MRNKSEELESIRATPTVGLDGRVDADIPCRQCGYNLRTLQPNGTCPECGLPVLPSLRWQHLAYGDPRLITRMALGAYVIAITPLLFMVAAAAFGWPPLMAWVT